MNISFNSGQATMKPESRLIYRLRCYLPKTVYVEKTNNPYRRGTPDLYIEGAATHLWVETKWESYAKRNFTPGVSAMQQLWLRRAVNNSQPVVVIVGSPSGALVLPGVSGLQRVLGAVWHPVTQVARWIESFVTGQYDPSLHIEVICDPAFSKYPHYGQQFTSGNSGQDPNESHGDSDPV